MAFIKSKQISLPNGGLIIGSETGNGNVLTLGPTGTMLVNRGNGPAWHTLNTIQSDNTFNKIVVEDTNGISLFVENTNGNDTVKVLSFAGQVSSDTNLQLSTTATSFVLATAGTEADIDIVLQPSGAGDVIIGNTGDGTIQGNDNSNLSILGGSGSGNLFISGGGTGKVYYSTTASAESEVATVGQVNTSTRVAQRNSFIGTDTFALSSKAIINTIIATINGVGVTDTEVSYNNNGTNVIATFNLVALDYTLDADDDILFVYDATL